MKNLLYGPGRRPYVSEFTRFIDGYLQHHPEVARDQLSGWYIWWDHTPDLAELERAKSDSVPLPPYSYQ